MRNKVGDYCVRPVTNMAKKNIIRLIQAIKERPSFMDERLKMLKHNSSDAKRHDFIWHYMLQSLSTMGNRSGWIGLIKTPENYNRVTFEALLKCNHTKRRRVLKVVFKNAKLRWPDRKAGWAAKNFNLIKKMGGVKTASDLAHSCKGANAKVRFMKKFSGIGDKYARNFWMDVYDPDFRNSIAIDKQIENITAALGISFTNYGEHEDFYRYIALKAGMQAWELDRLLFNFTPYFLWAIDPYI